MENPAIIRTPLYNRLLFFYVNSIRDEKSRTADQSLIRIVVSYPEPVKGVFLEKSQSTVTTPNSNRPDVSGFLESKGRMAWVSPPQSIRQLGSCLDLWREGSVRGPKVRSCRGLHQAAWSFQRLYPYGLDSKPS